MQTMIINASPRKTGNTAELLREAQKGAESVSARTELVHLYDLSFMGCRSCLACKYKGMARCKCYWRDQLSPLIDKILKSDAVIIGSPVYFGEPTAGFRALYERLAFCCFSYDGETSYFNGRVNVGLVYTMNAPENYYENILKPAVRGTEAFLGTLLKGSVRTYAACDTTQVDNYSEYNMGMFDPEKKKARREKHFPVDLAECFKLGAEVSR